MIRALIIAICAALPASAHDGMYRMTITRIVDGDTAEASIDLGLGISISETLRFSCIDTPEKRGDTREAGLRATEIAADWIMGTSGWAHIEGRGRYGRMITVYVPDGWRESFNRRILREGIGKVEAYSRSHELSCAEME